jgi:hypothetical protein
MSESRRALGLRPPVPSVSVTTHELRALMASWLAAECSVISERSGDMTYDLTRLREDAVGRCQRLGLRWTEDLFPEWVRDTLAWIEEYDG